MQLVNITKITKIKNTEEKINNFENLSLEKETNEYKMYFINSILHFESKCLFMKDLLHCIQQCFEKKLIKN